MSRHIRKTIATLLAILLSSLPCLAAEEAAKPRLISRYFKIERNAAGEPTLATRDKPIVVGFIGFDDANRSVVEKSASLYAAAVDQPITASGEGVNLLLIRAKNINRGDKLDIKILKDLKLPEPVIATFEQTAGWSQGCGYGLFIGKNGKISSSVALIDENITAEKQRDCLLRMIAYSFGLLMPADTTQRSSVFFIAGLLAHADECGKKIGHNEQELVKCLDEIAVRL